MRRLALVGSVALGCSAVNPLFSAADGAASGDGGTTSGGSADQGPGPGPGPGSDTDSNGSTDETGSSEAGEGSTTGEVPDDSIARCPEFLWAAVHAKDLLLVRTADWRFAEFELPPGFSGGASAVAALPATGRVIAFGAEAEGVAVRDPWDEEMVFVDLPTENPVLRATHGPWGESVYFMQDDDPGLYKLVDTDEGSFRSEDHRGVGNVAGDGDLAPVEDANGLLLLSGPGVAFYVPLDPKQDTVALNLTGSMAAVQVTGLALSAGSDYWASNATQMWHVTYDPPELEPMQEPSYKHVGADLEDLAAVYLPSEECEEMHALLEAE